MQPVRPAGRRVLIRRASLDLIGLPPTPEEVEAFVRDRSPPAFAKVVDRLLASPHYGERWGRYWLDLARYADDRLNDTRDDPYPNAYRYRDWVVQALKPGSSLRSLRQGPDCRRPDGAGGAGAIRGRPGASTA